MTTYYVGSGGNDSNSGLTWALRKLTLNGAEDVPVAARDTVYVAPGVYRETLTCDVSGGNSYTTGTISVTNGNTTVTGSGTTFSGNVLVGDEFKIDFIVANASDGVTNATSTFTSATASFQSDMVGLRIDIDTKGAYRIATYVSTSEITLEDFQSLGWPSSGSSLTFRVKDPVGPIEIESVDNNTQLTLKKVWPGKTLTGLSYETWSPIRYIADVLGLNTDGIGGVVRITGSDNDQSAARSNCIIANAKTYRTFRGFKYDMASTEAISLSNSSTNAIIEYCIFGNQGAAETVDIAGASQADASIRKCIFLSGTSLVMNIQHASTVDNAGHLIENCFFVGGRGDGIRSSRVGGIAVKNCVFVGFTSEAIDIRDALTAGQTVDVNNCIFFSNIQAVEASATGELIEDYNSFFANNTNRINVNTGSNSIAYPPLFNSPILVDGFKFSWIFGELSEWSQIARIAGTGEATDDLFGMTRPTTSAKKSWGAIQFVDAEVESGTVQSGTYGRVLNDAGVQFVRRVPVTNVSTTFTLYARRETNYAGSAVRLIVREAGQSDTTDDMTVAVNTWEQLSVTLTPQSTTRFVDMLIESRNTATSGSYAVFYDTGDVT